MITDNTGPNGELNTDAFQLAMLQYRNTPNQNTKLSPGMCIFGRPIKDFIPIIPGKYKPHETWRSILQCREEALRNRHMKTADRLSEHTKQLPPLVVGNRVRLQNQIGAHPQKWDKTGSIVEVRQFDQYVVRVDGSGRVTLRNRKFLRKYIPVILLKLPVSITDLVNPPTRLAVSRNDILPRQPTTPPPPIGLSSPSATCRSDSDIPAPSSPLQLGTVPPSSPSTTIQVEPSSSDPPADVILRRSTRAKRQPTRFSDYEMS